MIDASGSFRSLATVGLALAVGYLAYGCTSMCPCGADLGDAVEIHDAEFSGEHVIDDGCLCRCGPDGELQRWAYDSQGTCDHEERECQGPGDRTETLDCS